MNGEHPFPTRRDFLERSAAAVTGLTLVPLEASSMPTPQSAPASGTSPDLVHLTIASAAASLRSRQLSPVELMEATLRRIELLNPKLGAFITVAADHAMDAARMAERDIVQGRYRGALHGIPYGVKDTHYTKGILTTAASPVLADFVPDEDATNVTRLDAAGACLVGKLNLPEFSFGGYTPGCRNPWDLSRNAGGSSGGSGCALAASLLMAATGGDTSGSIRNPAATNGCVGLKPTFGVVSRHAVVPISWTLDHLGPMATTVEDAAILLQALAGHDPKDPFSARVTPPDYLAGLRQPVKGLRAGYMSGADMAGFHPDTIAAFHASLKTLQGLGVELREVTFPARMKATGATQQIIRIAEAATYHRQYLRSVPERYRTTESDVRTTVEAGSLLTAAQYLRAQNARRLFIEDMAAVMAPLDVYLNPTMPSPAGVEVSPAETYRNWWNVCGYPALSLPCGFSTSPAGLPIGLQVSGKPFEDAKVLQVAYAFEAATDWHARRPTLS